MSNQDSLSNKYNEFERIANNLSDSDEEIKNKRDTYKMITNKFYELKNEHKNDDIKTKIDPKKYKTNENFRKILDQHKKKYNHSLKTKNDIIEEEKYDMERIKELRRKYKEYKRNADKGTEMKAAIKNVNNKENARKGYVLYEYNWDLIPKHSISGIFVQYFNPTIRMINNFIMPSTLCGNLIHYYYESSLYLFVLNYVIIPMIFPFVFNWNNYCYGKLNQIKIIYYFHLLRQIFHIILDIPLAMFDTKYKNIHNDKKHKKWRFSYNIYCTFTIIIASIVYHCIDYTYGPRITLKELKNFIVYNNYYVFYIFIIILNIKIDPESIVKNFKQKMETKEQHSLTFGISLCMAILLIIDIIYITILMYKSAKFDKFSKQNTGKLLTRYFTNLTKRFIFIEIPLYILFYFITNNDITIYTFTSEIKKVSGLFITAPIIAIIYGISQYISEWINNKFGLIVSKTKDKLMSKSPHKHNSKCKHD